MSEPQKKRRQFLADALFAGGAVGAAALGARWFSNRSREVAQNPEPTATASPAPTSTPSSTPTPTTQETCPPVGPGEPHIGGAVAPPDSRPAPAPAPRTK